MTFRCQFSLILAVRNHGFPNKNGYGVGSGTFRTTAEISLRFRRHLRHHFFRLALDHYIHRLSFIRHRSPLSL